MFTGKGRDLRLSYLIRPNEIKGGMVKSKFKECGLVGRDIGMLIKKGKLEKDGKVFLIKDFKEPDIPAPVTLIIDCCSIE